MKRIWLLLLLSVFLVSCTAKQGVITEGIDVEPDDVILEEPEDLRKKPEQEESKVLAGTSDASITEKGGSETQIYKKDISPIIYCPTGDSDEGTGTPKESGVDLEFFFCLPGGGDYGFWIAPEGSDEWIAFQDHCAGSCMYAKNRNVELTMLKYQFQFESETNGMYKIRTVSTSSGEVFDEWRNIPILDCVTLIYAYYMDIWSYHGIDGEQSKHTLVVDKMDFCDECPPEWLE